MNDRDRKKAGQDGIAVACRLHPELTRAELAEAAARYHFGDTVEAGEAGLPEIYERLQKAVDCRAVYGLNEEKREAAAVITLGACVDAAGGVSEAGIADGSLSGGLSVQRTAPEREPGAG